MCPFNIQGRFSFPPLARIGPWQTRPAILIDDSETRWRCNPELGIKGGQISRNIWVIVSVDDRDCLAATVGRCRTKRYVVKPVGCAKLGRRIATDRGAGVRN